jgi:hypothetical protein
MIPDGQRKNGRMWQLHREGLSLRHPPCSRTLADIKFALLLRHKYEYDAIFILVSTSGPGSNWLLSVVAGSITVTEEMRKIFDSLRQQLFDSLIFPRVDASKFSI